MALISHAVAHVVTSTAGALSEMAVFKLACFLNTKYASSDIGVPAKMSPSAEVDAVWHALLLRPNLYTQFCIMLWTTLDAVTPFPGVVDHDPAAAADPEAAKELRRALAAPAAPCAPEAGERAASESAPPASGTRKRSLADAEEERPFRVFVTMLTGKVYTFEVYNSTTSLCLKHMVQVKEGTPVPRQRLVFCGHTLGDDEVLVKASVDVDSSIHLVVRISGC